MNIILGDLVERNISKRVLMSLSLVVLAIGFIDFIFLILNELSDLSSTYSFFDVLQYSILSMPYRLYDLSSYVCLVGVILGLGTLFDQGEIIGTRVLGKSNTRIAIAAFRPILVIMIFGLLASEFYIPELSQSAEENRLLQKKNPHEDRGYWIASDNRINNFLFAPDRKTLVGLTIYEFNSNNNPEAIITSSNAYLEEEKWILSKPIVIKLKDNSQIKGDDNYYRLNYSQKELASLLSPQYLSLSDLFFQIRNTASDYRRSQLSLEFWRKSLQPLVTLSLLVLALSFLFGPMRDQRSGQRVVIGIGVAFGIDLFQKLMGSIAVVSNFPIVLSVLFPIFLILLYASFAFKRSA